MTTQVATQQAARAGSGISLVASFAQRFGVEPAKLFSTLKATVFDGKGSEEEMIAFMAVAHRYDLDPFRSEIYAFRKQGGGIQPMVGVDGWSRVINRQESLDGLEFDETFDDGKLVAVTCKIHRKDRSHPTRVTEYLAECKRNTPPWNQMPSRMLRHRAMIQCARIAFGISGLMDEDEAAAMQEAQVVVHPPEPTITKPTRQKPRTLADIKAREAEKVAPAAAESPEPQTAGEALAADDRNERFGALLSRIDATETETISAWAQGAGVEPIPANWSSMTDEQKDGLLAELEAS